MTAMPSLGKIADKDAIRLHQIRSQQSHLHKLVLHPWQQLSEYPQRPATCTRGAVGSCGSSCAAFSNADQRNPDAHCRGTLCRIARLPCRMSPVPRLFNARSAKCAHRNSARSAASGSCLTRKIHHRRRNIPHARLSPPQTAGPMPVALLPALEQILRLAGQPDCHASSLAL